MIFEGGRGGPKVTFEEHLGTLLGASLGPSGAQMAPCWASLGTAGRPKEFTGTRLVLLAAPLGSVVASKVALGLYFGSQKRNLNTTFNQHGSI